MPNVNKQVPQKAPTYGVRPSFRPKARAYMFPRFDFVHGNGVIGWYVVADGEIVKEFPEDQHEEAYAMALLLGDADA